MMPSPCHGFSLTENIDSTFAAILLFPSFQNSDQPDNGGCHCLSYSFYYPKYFAHFKALLFLTYALSGHMHFSLQKDNIWLILQTLRSITFTNILKHKKEAPSLETSSQPRKRVFFSDVPFHKPSKPRTPE